MSEKKQRIKEAGSVAPRKTQERSGSVAPRPQSDGGTKSGSPAPKPKPAGSDPKTPKK